MAKKSKKNNTIEEAEVVPSSGSSTMVVANYDHTD